MSATEEVTRRRRGPVWVESLVLLAVALVVALVVKTFLVQAFYIPSGSMEPGFVKDDRILVQKVSSWFGGSPSRGDVVVFRDPGDWLPDDADDEPTSLLARALTKVGLRPSGGHLVKRVIGVAGETVACCDARGRITVDGVALDESYISPQQTCNGPMVPTCDWTSGTIPDGHVFVMGDHRDDSLDSSVHLCLTDPAPDCDPTDAFVPVDLVVGKVFALVWPLDRFTTVGRPNY